MSLSGNPDLLGPLKAIYSLQPKDRIQILSPVSNITSPRQAYRRGPSNAETDPYNCLQVETLRAKVSLVERYTCATPPPIGFLAFLPSHPCSSLAASHDASPSVHAAGHPRRLHRSTSAVSLQRI